MLSAVSRASRWAFSILSPFRPPLRLSEAVVSPIYGYRKNIGDVCYVIAEDSAAYPQIENDILKNCFDEYNTTVNFISPKSSSVLNITPSLMAVLLSAPVRPAQTSRLIRLLNIPSLSVLILNLLLPFSLLMQEL